MAKCGVAGPTSSSTSSIVGSTRSSGSCWARSSARLYRVSVRAPCGTASPPTSSSSSPSLFWSFNFTVVKYALTHGWEPLAYSSVRFAIGAVLFSAFTYAREHTLRVERASTSASWSSAAALGIWLNQLTFVYAVRLTTAATVALMFGTLPIFVALVAVALPARAACTRVTGSRRSSRSSGVALVAAGASSGLSGDLGGILLGLGASVTWAGYSVAMGPLMQRYSPYRISAFMLIVGSIPLLVSAARQLAEQDWAELDAARVGLLRLQPLLLARLHEHHVVHGHRPGRRGAGLALREPAAVPGRLLRARRPLGGDERAPGRRRRSSSARGSSSRARRGRRRRRRTDRAQGVVS